MSRRSKYSAEEKLKIVEAYLSGKIGVCEAGDRIGVDEKNMDEDGRAVVLCLENGKNYGEIAQKYNVSYQQVYTWVKKFSQLGAAGLEDRRGKRTAQQSPRTPEEELKARIAQLEHENYMLKMERDLLKKVKELERRDRWGK